MIDEASLRQRYLRHLKIGIGLLVLLAVPATLHSHAAIDGLFNRPADWVPDELPVKSEFNHFIDYFSANDLAMLAWEGSDLGSASLERAARVLQPLCRSSFDAAADAERLQRLPGWAQAEISEIRQRCNLATPFVWVRTGTETLEQMTSAPANLPEPVAIGRLQGSLVGPEGKQTCLVLAFSEEGAVHRRFLIPAVRSMVGRITDQPAEKIAFVGGPFEGAAMPKDEQAVDMG